MPLPTFTTGRLWLVPAAAGDLDALWTVWRDPDVRRYLFDDEPVSRERAAEVLASCRESEERGLGLWIIRPRDADGLIGCAGLMPLNESVVAHDGTLAGLAEPVAALAPGVWGNGYAHESLAALIGYAFDALALPRLIGVNDVPNVASARMLDRLGFVALHEQDGPRYRMRVSRLDKRAFDARKETTR
jgi:ribosomal-protein-alanine N-acetyltransferase